MAGGHNRSRSNLAAEQQAELVADYQAGMKRVDLTTKYNLFAPQIYAYLRKNDVQANRHKLAPRLHCVVCGAEREMPAYSPNDIWRRTPTCGDTACKSIYLLRPELRRISSGPRRPGWCSLVEPVHGPWENLRDPDIHHDITHLDDTELAALERAFHLGSDERGVDVTETARASLWGRLSRMAIAVHLRSEKPTDTAVRLTGAQPRARFLKAYFGNAGDEAVRLANAFDVLYLWRCSCPQQTSYVCRTLSDLPEEPGDYGVCPACASAALEIR